MAGNGRGWKPLALVGQDADARFYVQRATARPGPVLVLGSASGRISRELAEHARVVAVDPSPVMVQAAELRRAGAPPDVAARLGLICADLRVLRLSERFPVVVAPQNALGLMISLEDVDALLATVRHHLEPGGIFLFDMLNPGGHGPARPEDGPTTPLEPARPVFVPHLRERRRSATGDATGSIRRLRLRQFYADEVDAALRRAGLVALERYGDFEGKPFDLEDALQIVVAQPEP